MVPERLLHDLANAPVMTEQQIDERTPSSHVGSLTPTQLLIVQHLSHGLSAPMVAEVEGKSVEIIKEQIKQARARMNAKHYGHLVAICLRQGLIE